MRFHAPTAFTTLGAVGLVVVLSAQQIVNSPAIVIRRIIDPVVVHQPAHPRDFVRIYEGNTYTVPPGRIYVIRSAGRSVHLTNGVTHVDVDGTTIFKESGGSLEDNVFEPGFMVPAGSAITVTGNGPSFGATVLGYLVDA